MKRTQLSVASLLLALVATFPAVAQDEPSADDVTKANNPLAEMVAVNFQNYYVPTFYGSDELRTNTFRVRFAKPVGRVLIRASLPISTVSASANLVESGLGDFNVFAAYLAVSEPAKTFGIGPLLAAPTASEDILGSGKWQAGAAAIAFLTPAPQVQLGGLLTWQHHLVHARKLTSIEETE